MKLLYLLLIPSLLFCTPPYEKIRNIYRPTVEDYRLIQNYLTNGERSLLPRLEMYGAKAREFRIIGTKPGELPESGLVVVNCPAEERENCILLYSSFNFNYPQGLKRVINNLSTSDFKGHILYHIGGWPNVEGGSLLIAHIPYAFKAASFKEAQRLGFKRAFWLDASMIPLVSLNKIFDMTAQLGYFVMGNNFMLGSEVHPAVLKAFKITPEEAFKIPNCYAGMIGIDFTTEVGTEIIDRWYQAAHHPAAFYSKRPEQFPFSIIIYQMGLSDKIISYKRLAEERNKINSDSLFFNDRGFVQPIGLKNIRSPSKGRSNSGIIG